MQGKPKSQKNAGTACFQATPAKCFARSGDLFVVNRDGDLGFCGIRDVCFDLSFFITF